MWIPLFLRRRYAAAMKSEISSASVYDQEMSVFMAGTKEKPKRELFDFSNQDI